MKEITDIIKAYQLALKQNKKVALATVVHVDGSSYRRPGARMLVTDDGQLTGAISGGCLEGDALRRALLAINENTNKLVTYDTTDDDDVQFGVQLGCNGIVHILFEPIDEKISNNPIKLLKRVLEFRSPSTLVTLFSLDKNQPQTGTYLCQNKEGCYVNDELHLDISISEALHSDLLKSTGSQCLQFKVYQTQEGAITALIETFQPVIHLVICGAGNDAIPLSHMVQLLGWEVTIVDGRQTHATTQRFPNTEIIVAKPQHVLESMVVDKNTYFVLMTHNYNYDLELLKQLVHSATSYIGVLGPKMKLRRMINDMAYNGVMLSPSQEGKIYGPVGLDIGAETAEEIALSISSEIQAVVSKRKPEFLREKQQPIHK